MFNSWKHISVLLMGLVLVALTACGGSQPLPDIDATSQTFFEPYGIMTAEAKLAAMPSHIDATVEAKLKEALAAIPPLPTYTPVPTPKPEMVEVVREVIKEVPVVIKEVPVEKIVTVVVEVERVVVVTATPTWPASYRTTATPMPTATPVPTTTPIPAATPTPTPRPDPALYTKVGGRLTADTLWILDESPYLITDTIEIPEGVTLTIEADVTVNVEDRIGFGFLVHGELEAEGTSESPITFIAGINWLFAGDGAPASMLIKLNHTHLKDGVGIYSAPYGPRNRGGFQLSNSVITNIVGIQIENPEGEIVIAKNTFYESGGIKLSGGVAPISIVNNKFVSQPKGSEGWWIRINSGNSKIEHNSFLDDGIAVGIWTGYGSSIYNLDISNNYWGTLDPKEIANRIMDYNDDLTRGGPLVFEPFLTEPHPDTP